MEHLNFRNAVGLAAGLGNGIIGLVSEGGSEKNPGLLRDGYFWSALALGGFVLSLTLWFGFGMDQSICAYSAWVWKEYHLPPYIGVWDLSFPGIFIIYRLGMTLSGQSIPGLRAFDFVIQLTTLAMVFHLSKKLSGQSMAGFLGSVFFAVLYYSSGPYDTLQRESYVLWLMLAALVCAFSLSRRPLLWAALAGFFLGFAFLVKPFYGLCWLVFAGLITSQSWRQKPRMLGELLVFAGACVLPSLVVVLFYLQAGYLKELYRAIIWFNFKVYGSGGNSPYGFFDLCLRIARSALSRNYVIILAGLMGIARLSRRKDARGLFWTLLGLMLATLVSYRLQNKYFPFHLYPFYAILVMFAADAFARLIAGAGAKMPSALRKIFYAVSLAVAISLVAAMVKPSLIEYSLKYSFRSLDAAYSAGFGAKSDPHFAADQYLAAKYLEPLLKPGDDVAFFGPYPLVQFLLKSRPLSRFCCLQHFLFMPRDQQMTTFQFVWMQEYSSAIISARPKYFLLADSFPGMKNKFLNLAGRSLRQQLHYDFPELEQLLAQRYRVISQIGDIAIYELAPEQR